MGEEEAPREAEGRAYLTEAEIRKLNGRHRDRARSYTINEIKALIVEWIDHNYDVKKHHFFSGFFSLRNFDKKSLKYGLEFDNARIKKGEGKREV